MGPEYKPMFKTDIKDIIKTISLTIIIFLISSPELSPVVETGLDGSANFAFNYFFANGLQNGIDVVFTYGPFGFLKSPLPVGNNFIYAFIFLSIIRFLFIYLILYAGKIIDPQKWLLHFFIALVIASLVSFDHALTGIIIASLLISFEKRQAGIWLIVAIVATVFALLIKSSTGVIALLIMMSYIFLDYFETRRFKATVLITGGVVIIFILSWLCLYGNLNGIFTYFYGTYNFIHGNSSAMALHPYNNWMIIISFIIIFLILPFTIWDKRVFFLYGPVLLSVFAYWKYSFSASFPYSHN